MAAESLLTGKPDRTFLVRRSHNDVNYKIDHVDGGRISHTMVTIQGGVCVIGEATPFTLEGCATLDEMIQVFSKKKSGTGISNISLGEFIDRSASAGIPEEDADSNPQG